MQSSAKDQVYAFDIDSLRCLKLHYEIIILKYN